MEFFQWFQLKVPNVSLFSSDSVLKLHAEGATVPFIARYRKEQTGNLDEVQIRAVIDSKEEWDEILKRQKFITEEIQKQNKLTDDLKKKIAATYNADQLEDLYLPFKVKRKTKATVAKEAGLEPLAEWLWRTGRGEELASTDLAAEASKYLGEKVKTIEEALTGAGDIVIERLAEDAELRQRTRDACFERAFLRSKKGPKVKENSKFEPYFEFSESFSRLLLPQNSHRYMALRRGWTEEELTVSFGGGPVLGGKPGEYQDDVYEAELLAPFEKKVLQVLTAPGVALLKKSARLALKAHVLPSIENEMHKSLKKSADEAAIGVFANNVKQLMLSAPFGSKTVLGIDPGIRTGCKLVVVTDNGQLVFDTVIFPNTSSGADQAKVLIRALTEQFKVQAIGIGNGTAGRETEVFVKQTLKELKLSPAPIVVMVNEAGASVYSASDVAREEFPDKDVTVRGAVSIARRLQDPLAELVKIDPKSIGVGQYQHDVNQSQLKKSLDEVVDSCVNSVGINLNTASYHLLSKVSGIGLALAKSIVQRRHEVGLFKNRMELKKVTRFGEKNFEQAAGFLRISDGDNPLDNTGVHPEKYELLMDFAKKSQKKIQDLLGPGVEIVKKSKELRDQLGQFSFDDIIKELEKPGRDPRENFAIFEFRADIHSMQDLKADMLCPGIVTNVTNFGAFVDIGVHQDGLVHISQLSNEFVKDPKDVVHPGQHVKVKVMGVDLSKKQISLTMKLEERAAQQPRSNSSRQQGNFQGRQNSSSSSSGGSSRSHSQSLSSGGSFGHSPFAALGKLSEKK